MQTFSYRGVMQNFFLSLSHLFDPFSCILALAVDNDLGRRSGSESLDHSRRLWCLLYVGRRRRHRWLIGSQGGFLNGVSEHVRTLPGPRYDRQAAGAELLYVKFPCAISRRRSVKVSTSMLLGLRRWIGVGGAFSWKVETIGKRTEEPLEFFADHKESLCAWSAAAKNSKLACMR